MMLLLDLFCGAGGAAMGYHRAGFTVVGVDNRPQRSYPFAFVQDDALHVLQALYEGEALYTGDAYHHLADFAAIHASPPCKRFTVARKVHATNRPTLFDPHDDLVEPTRALLLLLGIPYVIENVPGAPLRAAGILCGSMFGLRVRRHRLFETNWRLAAPRCRHADQPEVVGVYGDGGAWTRSRPGGGGRKVVGAEAAAALGIDWTERQSELAQAIPPAYTQFVGARLRAHLAVAA